MADLSSLNKALELNLDQSIYGTFAEIGAGQEVANWFFKASASAGTVAKSISAYDMTVSDAIYGKSARYVSRERMVSMLDAEFNQLIERLNPQRGDNTTFFAYTNTVRARGYKDNGECFGWMGIRFQLKPGDPPSDILLHVRLLDEENVDQMEALGVVGLNLIYAAFKHRNNLKRFVESLVDNIDHKRVEIDMLKFTGAGFQQIDNRLCALQLVKSKLAMTAMFNPKGEVVQAAETLYGKPVILLRGSFRPTARVHLELMRQTHEQFSKCLTPEDSEKTIELCEISMANMLRGEEIDTVDAEDFLNRCDSLKALGKTVMISRCPEFHRLISVLSRYTKKPVAIVLSIGLLHELFKEKWSDNLAGGVLESFGRLFKNGNQLYVSSWFNKRKGSLVTADIYKSPENYRNLYQHFLENNMVNAIELSNINLLKYNGRDLLKMIGEGEETWKEFIPEEIHQYVENMRFD